MGVYTTMYYGHNLHFIVVAHNLQGRHEEAKRAAERLLKTAGPHLQEMPEMGDYFVPVALSVPLQFGQWDEVLAAPEPGPKLAVARAFWHYARAVAQAGRGRTDDAERERRAFAEARAKVPDKSVYGQNTAADVLKVAAGVLDARLAEGPAAVEHWKKAVVAQDTLAYAEPEDWYYPVRVSLGAALLRGGQVAEAEKVFRDDLQRHRRNGRSLYGLWKCLQAQKNPAAAWVRLEFERAWKGPEPRLEDF
jgi:hypothetical protein